MGEVNSWQWKAAHKQGDPRLVELKVDNGDSYLPPMHQNNVHELITPWVFPVAKSCPIVQLYGPQNARLLCSSLSPRVCSNSCPLSRWCHPTISSSVTPFPSCPQSPSGFFSNELASTSGGWTIGTSASASVLPMNIQSWLPLGLTGLISLQSKGLLRVFCTTVGKHPFLSAQPPVRPNSHIHPLGLLNLSLSSPSWDTWFWEN